jgi:hypothetical protein
MEFTGRIAKVLPMQTGVGKNNNEWKRQDFIFEFFENPSDRWSDKVVLSVMNDRIAEYDMHEDDAVRIGFGHNVQEWNGRYYNELRMYKFEKISTSQPTAETSQPTQHAPAAQETTDEPPF